MNYKNTSDDEKICKYIAFGLIATGVEGAYNGYNPDTGANGYPAVGVSGWTDNRLQNLLGMIPGGDKYQNKTSSDFESDPALKQGLLDLLDSPNGQKAQQTMLANDSAIYVTTSKDYGLTDPKVLIYVGIWQPTSTTFAPSMASKHGGNDLNTVHNYFKTQYYADAKVGSQYAGGYANRADKTLYWVNQCDLSKDPDPNMIINFDSALAGGLTGKALSSDSGFRYIEHGKTVTIIKLPENKTFAEPIYPDLITVSDTVPQWIIDVAVQKQNTKIEDNNKQEKNNESNNKTTDTKK